MPLRRPRPDPALAAIVAEGFFSRLSFGFVSFGLPLFAHRLGMSVAEIGLLLSLNLAVAIPLKPLAGRVADRAGLKRALVAAIVLRTVVAALLVLARDPWHLVAVRALHGVSIALRDPASHALIAAHGRRDAIARSFSWYQTAKTVAGSAGKAGAGFVLGLTASSFPAVFAVAFALSTVPLWVVTRQRTPLLLPYAGLGFLVAGTAYMLANLFPLLAVEYAGLSPGQVGLLYLLSTVVSLSGPLFGWLADRRGAEPVLRFRAVANAASSLAYLVSPTLGGFAVGRVLDDAGKAAFRPAWGSVMARLSAADPCTRARTMGTLGMGEDAGEVAGPIVAGLIWGAFGVPALLLARVVLAALTEWYALRLGRHGPPAGPATEDRAAAAQR